MEHWNRAYREAPEVFDAFTRAEDPDGLVVRTLLSRAELDGRSVLEIGCGTGRYTQELAGQAGLYLALERSAPMLRLARERFRDAPLDPHLVCARAEEIPLRTGSLDHVIAGWVVINLRPESRAVVLREIDRVLGRTPGGAAWLIENHWTGEFQDLRGRRPDAEKARVRELIDSAGFQLVDVVETELRFPSTAACERVLGYLCGETARDRLRRKPRATLTHNVIILRRPVMQ